MTAEQDITYQGNDISFALLNGLLQYLYLACVVYSTTDRYFIEEF